MQDSTRSRRDALARLLPSPRWLLLAAGALTTYIVVSAVDNVTVGPGLLIIVELGEQWCVELAAGVLAIFTFMLLFTWLQR